MSGKKPRHSLKELKELVNRLNALPEYIPEYQSTWVDPTTSGPDSMAVIPNRSIEGS